MTGRERIDLAVDPPPDLAIESNDTPKTRIKAYLAINVPELCVYDVGKLTIHVLKGDRYIESATSPNFPGILMIDIVPKTIA